VGSPVGAVVEGVGLAAVGNAAGAAGSGEESAAADTWAAGRTGAAVAESFHGASEVQSSAATVGVGGAAVGDVTAGDAPATARVPAPADAPRSHCMGIGCPRRTAEAAVVEGESPYAMALLGAQRGAYAVVGFRCDCGSRGGGRCSVRLAGKASPADSDLHSYRRLSVGRISQVRCCLDDQLRSCQG
jgi:hypothetical protein